jgi:hypothetical protein
MGMALSLSGPLKLNTQRTQSEINEQEGIVHLCKGLTCRENYIGWNLAVMDHLNVRRFESLIQYWGP